MIPKFTLSRDRLFISEKYICNGHWLLTRDIVNSPVAPKALKPLLACRNGTYHDGIAGGLSVETTPDMAHVIPNRTGYELLNPDPSRVEFKNCDWIESYVFKFESKVMTDSFEIGVNPKYVPLLRLGHIFAKDSRSPILILGGNTLNDEFLGVVMPMRLPTKEVNNA